MSPERVSNVMECAIGWLLDVTVERNAATLWIKTIEQSILKLVNKYQVRLFFIHIKLECPAILTGGKEWRDIFTKDKFGVPA